MKSFERRIFWTLMLTSSLTLKEIAPPIARLALLRVISLYLFP